ncbi:Alpha-snap [Giardia lamblia P15]|uniref:Alpha-snap n=1 Tax=Giardia intestinalis (strain P15) TaxID=658858 RepID=E1F906_GIAIA|nr:Alpha-snap [Giardia lamblia P15]
MCFKCTHRLILKMSLIDAEKLVKSAEKSAKKGLFSKPNPDAALSDYREAGKIFKQLGAMDRAQIAFIRAAESAISAKMEQPAAVLYREAAECARQQLGIGSVKKSDVASLHRKCAEYMCLAGKFLEAAREYVNMCKYLDSTKDVDSTMKQALALFEQEKRPMQACSTIMELIDTICLDKAQLNNVLQLVEKATEMYRSMVGYGFKVDMLTLFHIVLLLTADDPERAREQLLKFDSFKDSATMAEDIINAYENGDKEAMDTARSNNGARITLTNNMLRVLDQLVPPEKTDAEKYL